VKPIASLSLDLDNKWSYLKTHGDGGWEDFPSYLEILVPRVLGFLKARNLTITFFIVGQDAALEKNHDMLKAIAAAGHEIGNHSFKHEPWLHLYSAPKIATEIALAEEHIERASGQKPIGFRGPGFSLSYPVLQELGGRGYLYDATTFPTFLIPVARAYYFLTARFTPEEKQQRRRLGGTFGEGFRPIKPYRWQVDGASVIEIPVTTMPVFKMPIHVSYLLCLSLLSHPLARWYLNAALKLCRVTGTQPSLLLHPTDFLGCDDTKDLSFFPAMSLPSAKKLEMVGDFLQVLCAQFTVLTLQQHARETARLPNLPCLTLKLRHSSNGHLT
jgi:hypothetical protein